MKTEEKKVTMKYIDAEKLKAEIERHIKDVKDAEKRFTPNMGFFDAKLSGIYDVLAIIDSLQQEQPEEKAEPWPKRDAWYIEIERQRQFIDPAMDIHEQL